LVGVEREREREREMMMVERERGDNVFYMKISSRDEMGKIKF
jgi:hypothetical protein